MIVDSLDMSATEFEASTGWAITPHGACHGEVCVPLPDGFSLVDAAQRLGMAIVADPTTHVWAVGPPTVAGRALTTAIAPELVLVDLDGKEFRLSSLRGQKVVLVAWAPY